MPVMSTGDLYLGVARSPGFSRRGGRCVEGAWREFCRRSESRLQPAWRPPRRGRVEGVLRHGVPASAGVATAVSRVQEGFALSEQTSIRPAKAGTPYPAIRREFRSMDHPICCRSHGAGAPSKRARLRPYRSAPGIRSHCSTAIPSTAAHNHDGPGCCGRN